MLPGKPTSYKAPRFLKTKGCNVYAEYGVAGLFKGLIPRMGLNIWQTLFMVTGAQMIKSPWKSRGSRSPRKIDWPQLAVK